MADDSGLDLVIHAPNRLRICALLAGAGAVEFAILRDFLQVSDSVLSKHLSRLEAAGYISTKREVRAFRSRVWAILTPQGRDAYHGHVRALQELIAAAPPPGASGSR
ncbi:MAG: transcriptional regulator [Dermatophilaceae bacterium]